MTTNGSTAVSSKLQLLFHGSSFSLFTYVLLWHFGAEAAKLPQAAGFGWFYKYLTFCGFNFQLLTLAVCLLADLFPSSERLKHLADDLSCATFNIANSISVLYWTILLITRKTVEEEFEGGVQKTTTHGLQNGAPLHIDLSIHLANAIIAWTDVTICERSFRTRAFVGSFAFGVFYMFWSQYATTINGTYAYPFLNAMPRPYGYILICVVSLTTLSIFSRIGSKIAGRPASGKKTKRK